MQNSYLTLAEQERAAYAAGDYELANALAEISALEDEVLRLQNLLDSLVLVRDLK